MKYSFIISFFFGITTSFAQTNLVSNGSFEDTIQCPNDFAQLNRTLYFHYSLY